MSQATGGRTHATALARTSPAAASKSYRAAVMGDGTVTPITERIGVRVIRQIEPLSAEGRALLSAGRVTLWHDDGARAEARPIGEVLDRLLLETRRLRAAHPRISGWTSHHDRVLRRIGRMRKALLS